MPESEPSKVLEKIKGASLGTPTEGILIVFKAILASTGIGSGLASLITDFIPNSRQRRLEEFAVHIAEDLAALQDRIKEEVLHTDDFAFMFEQCFRGVAENPHAVKIQAFRGILVNSAIGPQNPPEEREYFLNLAGALSVLHLRILKFSTFPNQYLAEEGIPEASIRGGFSQFFPVAIPGIPVDVLRAAFGDLYRYGLLNIDEKIFSGASAGQGLDLLDGRTSDLGKRFMKFCISPASDK